MILSFPIVLLVSAAFGAPAVPAVSTTAANSAMIGVSTYTVSTLYTGDRVRDPFLATSHGASARIREAGKPLVIDIHALQLRGIMEDSGGEYALFSTDDGMTLVLKGGRLFDDRNKPVPGITGHTHIKQKRADLVTADKDVQIYKLGEVLEEDKDRPGKP
jgi:hypothetical protein